MLSIISDGFINQSYSVILCFVRYKNHIVNEYVKIYLSTKNKITPNGTYMVQFSRQREHCGRGVERMEGTEKQGRITLSVTSQYDTDIVIMSMQ